MQDSILFLLLCRGRACPARSFAVGTPLTAHIVGRGLDPSAAGCGHPALRSPVYLTRRGGIHPSRDMCAACGASGTPPPTPSGEQAMTARPRPTFSRSPYSQGRDSSLPGHVRRLRGVGDAAPLQPSKEQTMTARPRPTAPAKAHTAVILLLRAPSPIPDIPPRWP